jgi:puromycin-sensitive aminopeptidase
VTPAITATLSQRLGYTSTYLVPDGRQAAFQAWVRARFGPELDATGIASAPGDDDNTQARRASLLGLVGALGNNAGVQAEAGALARRYMDDPSAVPGTLVATVLGVAAAGGGEALYDRYLARLDGLGANPEEYYRYFNALASFTEPALAARTLEYALSPAVRAQDSPTLLAGLLGQPASQAQAWAFVQTRWADVEAKLGDTFGGIQAIVGSLGSFCSADAAADVDAFFAANPTPAAERGLGRALERIRSCAAIQARQMPAVGAWLDTLP